MSLALENIPIGRAPRAADVIRMVKELASPAVRICYDAANAHYAGEDPASCMADVAPWLEVLHLADTNTRH